VEPRSPAPCRLQSQWCCESGVFWLGRRATISKITAVVHPVGKGVEETPFWNTAPPPKPTDVVPRIRQQLFVIYAPDGGVETLSPTNYRLAGGQKTIWGIPGVGHMGGFDAHPKECERRVVAFFDHALAAVAHVQVP
jgi:hypothetical protein